MKFHSGLVESVKKIEKLHGGKTGGFAITTQAGEKFTTKKLIFATGLQDLTPNIKGLSECWGISVVHCPYCHGFEFRNQKTGILANGERAMHGVPLIYNLTKKINHFNIGSSRI